MAIYLVQSIFNFKTIRLIHRLDWQMTFWMLDWVQQRVIRYYLYISKLVLQKNNIADLQKWNTISKKNSQTSQIFYVSIAATDLD
jgi:hypothetical protein